MCLVAVALNEHPEYPFVLVANRDEFRERPSAPAHFWKESPNILAGIDLKMNGTWLGITRTGRLALITNYRDLTNIRENAPSRGHLVSKFLRSDKPIVDHINSIDGPEVYNGFNLLAGNTKELTWFSNISEEQSTITSGIHGLSNALLDTPWPKVEALKNGLKDTLGNSEVSAEVLFGLLASDTTAPDHLLPETGVGLELERLLSSAFINSENYGTVCSTVILIDKKGAAQFIERSFDALGAISGQVNFSFPIEA